MTVFTGPCLITLVMSGTCAWLGLIWLTPWVGLPNFEHREGRLKPAGRTATGRRYYTEDQILAFRHQRPATTGPRKTVAYCRVSSQSQRPDLKNQRATLEQFCTARGLANVEFIEEIGGGMNFGRKRFLALMDAVDAGEISTMILAHKDRLTRFGYKIAAKNPLVDLWG